VSTLGDPDEIESLAAQYLQRASDIEQVGNDVRRQVGESTWTSAKADRFRAETHRHEAEATGLAGEFRELAAELRAAAANLRTELSELDGIERSIRSTVDGFRPNTGVAPPWEGTRWNPANLPPRGDPAWRSVARDLRLDR
jgi:uncharacterized protein YukE